MNNKVEVRFGAFETLAIIAMIGALTATALALVSIDKSLKIIASPPVDEVNQMSEKAAE